MSHAHSVGSVLAEPSSGAGAMSLPGSPHSLSGDDFAALLDFELQAGSEEEENCAEDGGVGVEKDGLDVAEHDQEPDEEAERQGLEEVCENEVKELAKQSARCPPHPGFMWEVCIRCGAQKAASETVEAGVGERVISQGDSTLRTSKDLDLGAESAVIILDNLFQSLL